MLFTVKKESCIINIISSFHATNNPCTDVMHDPFDGVTHYDVILISPVFCRERYELHIKIFRSDVSYPPNVSNGFHKISSSVSEML